MVRFGLVSCVAVVCAATCNFLLLFQRKKFFVSLFWGGLVKDRKLKVSRDDDINGHRIPRRGKLQVFGVVHIITGAGYSVVVTILYGPHGVA